MKRSILNFFFVGFVSVEAFSVRSPTNRVAQSSSTQLNESSSNRSNYLKSFPFPAILTAGIIGSSIFFPGNAIADEIGREVEAPTLFTGETVLVRNLILVDTRLCRIIRL